MKIRVNTLINIKNSKSIAAACIFLILFLWSFKSQASVFDFFQLKSTKCVNSCRCKPIIGQKNSAKKKRSDYYQNRITGLPPSLLKNVLARLAVEQAADGDEFTPELAQRWFNEGVQNIELALQPYGYFKAQVSSHLERNKDLWIANYEVNLGPAVHIQRIDLHIAGEGNQEKAFIKFQKNLPFAVGDIFNSQNYQQAKQKLFDIANRLGFLKAKFIRNDVEVDTEKNTAVIILYFNTGPRYYFGPFNFQQNAYAESYLRRFLFIHPGDPFSSLKLIKLQRAFNDSGNFQLVNVQPLLEQEKNYQIPVDIKLEPYKSQQYLFGLGYGTDTRYRATLGVNFRHVTDTGQQFKTLIQASPVQSNFQALYSIPGPNPLTDQFTIGLGVNNNLPQNLYSRTEKFSVSYVTQLQRWTQTYALNYQHDSFTNNPPHGVNTFYPSVTWQWLSVKDTLHVDNGERFTITGFGGKKALLSDINFAQVQTTEKFIRTYAPTNTRLVLNGNFNYTWAPTASDKANLPLSMQFFAGGAQSLRGYGYQNIGPGRLLLLGSSEIQQKVYKEWYVGAFYETGNASNQLRKLLRDAGGSLIWFSPIGPVEVSIAKPIGDPTNTKLHFQLNMGTDL